MTTDYTEKPAPSLRFQIRLKSFYLKAQSLLVYLWIKSLSIVLTESFISQLLSKPDEVATLKNQNKRFSHKSVSVLKSNFIKRNFEWSWLKT